ncbi:hypothetical protein PS712_04124 [Pseudomonas fluorescens]|uniref:Uncharacterized protein n=1 Tax=Pseudomonas fluorescens TaxID=294 RepID=A0A5E7DTA9_PSEFL|nr:hypothetical protein PS712_04124 [Pseudomonas fluorescens]
MCGLFVEEATHLKLGFSCLIFQQHDSYLVTSLPPRHHCYVVYASGMLILWLSLPVNSNCKQQKK